MGKLIEFSINLDTNQQVYYPGSQVTGYVVLNLNEPMKMRGLRIEFEGKGHCHWSEEKGSGDDKRTVHYEEKEKIFDQMVCLFGNQPNTGSNILSHPGGRHTYQFVFTLPPNLPTSFEGRHGHIRYVVKALIDRPWKFDHKVKQPVTINEIIDTNHPQYSQGPGGEKHKQVGCLCCAAGPLDVIANIDRSCYCPGEAILINCQVYNHTTRDMTAIKAKLSQSIKYCAEGNTNWEFHSIANLRGPPTPKGQVLKWENQVFGIPAVPPSITNSKVIKIEYNLKVEVDVPWGSNPSIDMPIVIGTVPYRPTYGQPNVQYGTPEDPQRPPASNVVTGSNYPPPQPSLFGYPDMPPPSYSAAVGGTQVNIGDESDNNTQGTLNYIPVYTFAQPYQGDQAPPLNQKQDPFNQPAIQHPDQNLPYTVNSNPPYPANGNPQYPSVGNSQYPANSNPQYHNGNPQYPPSQPTTQYPSSQAPSYQSNPGPAVGQPPPYTPQKTTATPPSAPPTDM